MQRTMFNENSNIIFKKLRDLRQKYAMSQEELATRMQVLGIYIDQQMISRIEHNKRLVKDYEVVAICKIFEISESELLSGFYDAAPK